jgi:signal peptidase I
MSPTLRIRDVVQFDPSAYKSSPIERGSVVVYRSEKHEGLLLASRVIGLSGQTIQLRGGKLLLNGEETPEPYVEADGAEEPFSREYGPTKVPDGTVFLLGDFRDVSEDSRFIGPVAVALVVGRVVV